MVLIQKNTILETKNIVTNKLFTKTKQKLNDVDSLQKIYSVEMSLVEWKKIAFSTMLTELKERQKETKWLNQV